MAKFHEREDDLENELNKGALWAITYGDMMSYLMIFFLILYVAVAGKDIRTQMGMQAMSQSFGNEAETIGEMFSKKGIQQIARLEVSQRKIRITFNSPVLFRPAGAEILPASMPHLKQLAAVLKDIPNDIQIEGHTDSIPLGPSAGYKTNWELSAARAFSVMTLLTEMGVPPDRMAAIGYGEFRPIQENDTAEGRAANRRIEVNIMRQET